MDVGWGGGGCLSMTRHVPIVMYVSGLPLGFCPHGILCALGYCPPWVFVPVGFCPPGLLSPLVLISFGFSPPGLLSPWDFVPLGFCLPGILATWILSYGFCPHEWCLLKPEVFELLPLGVHAVFFPLHPTLTLEVWV